MLTAILLIVGIANLAMLIRVYLTLKSVGKELNQIEHWKGIPAKHYF